MAGGTCTFVQKRQHNVSAKVVPQHAEIIAQTGRQLYGMANVVQQTDKLRCHGMFSTPIGVSGFRPTTVGPASHPQQLNHLTMARPPMSRAAMAAVLAHHTVITFSFQEPKYE